jgi:hypothetical protein
MATFPRGGFEGFKEGVKSGFRERKRLPQEPGSKASNAGEGR